MEAVVVRTFGTQKSVEKRKQKRTAKPVVEEVRGSTTEESNKVYSIQRTADLMGVSRQTVHRMIDRGDIKYVRLGRRRYVPASAVTKLIPTETPKSTLPDVATQPDKMYYQMLRLMHSNLTREMRAIEDRLSGAPGISWEKTSDGNKYMVFEQ